MIFWRFRSSSGSLPYWATMSLCNWNIFCSFDRWMYKFTPLIVPFITVLEIRQWSIILSTESTKNTFINSDNGKPMPINRNIASDQRWYPENALGVGHIPNAWQILICGFKSGGMYSVWRSLLTLVISAERNETFEGNWKRILFARAMCITFLYECACNVLCGLMCF